jgi:hypothetical protein
MRAKRRTKRLIKFLIESAEIERIEQLERALEARHPGTRITRSDAARAVVNVGLRSLEREMGIPALREKRPPPVPRRSAGSAS